MITNRSFIAALLLAVTGISGCSSAPPERDYFNQWATKQLRTDSTFARACRGDEDALDVFLLQAIKLQKQDYIDAERLVSNRWQLWFILEKVGDDTFSRNLTRYDVGVRQAILRQLDQHLSIMALRYPRSYSMLK